MKCVLKISLAFFLGNSLALLAVDPRIDILSPYARVQHSEFQVIDLDGDGDQDFLVNPEDGPIDWFETLPSGKISPPKQLHLPLQNFKKAHFIDRNHDGVLEIVGITETLTGTVDLFGGVSASANSVVLWHSDPLGSGNKSGFQKIANLDNSKIGFIHLERDFSISQIVKVPSAVADRFTLHEISDQLTIEPWSNQTFNLPSIHWSPDEDVYALDLDGDHDSDLIVFLSGQIALFERTGDRSFSETPVVISGSFYQIADLDRDGDFEIYGGQEWLNDDENFTFTPSPLPSLPSDITFQQRIQDTPGAGVWFLSAPHWDSSEAVSLEETPLSATVTQLHLDSNNSWVENLQLELQAPDHTDPDFKVFIPSASAADLDQDGNLDFISHIIRLGQAANGDLINHSSIKGYNPAQSGNLPVLESEAYSHPHSLRPAVGDFDEDGDLDIIVGPNQFNEHFLLRNDGSGAFTWDTLPLDLLPSGLGKEDYYTDFITPIDLDEDGRLDLSISIVEISSGEVACTVISGNGDGSFESPALATDTFSPVTSEFCGITEFIDWDLDGDLDAILEGGWRENVDGSLSTDFRPLLQNIAVSDALGNPVILSGHTIGDIDGDGAPDYVALAAKKIQSPALGGFSGNYSPLYCPAGYLCTAQLGVAFNDGSGGIASVSYYNSDLVVSDALGNPLLGPCVAQDWNKDGTDELIIGEMANDALGNAVVAGTIQVLPARDSPRDLSSGFALRSIGTTGTKRELTDFNADGLLEYVNSSGFVTPTPTGPLFSPRYDFVGDYRLDRTVFSFRRSRDFISPIDFTTIPGINYSPFIAAPSTAIACADFDGDGDLDTLHSSSNSGLYLVRNLIVDERSPITAELMQQGLLGSEATPDADFDGDGLSNAHEYLFGTDPTAAQNEEPADLSPKWTTHEGLAELTFLRRLDATQLKLDYRLERSTDLQNWEKIPFGDTESTPLSDTWESVTTKGLIQGSRYFYRSRPEHRP